MSLLRTTARSLTFRPSVYTAVRFNSTLTSKGVHEDQDNRDRDLAPRRRDQKQDVQGAAANVAMNEKEEAQAQPSDPSMPAPGGSTNANSHAGKDKAIGMQDERGAVSIMCLSIHYHIKDLLTICVICRKVHEQNEGRKKTHDLLRFWRIYIVYIDVSFQGDVKNGLITKHISIV